MTAELRDSLAQVQELFPNARVHVLPRRQKPKPRVGDIKVVKGIRYVRVLRPAYGYNGRVIGHQVSNGRTLFDWKRCDPVSGPELMKMLEGNDK